MPENKDRLPLNEREKTAWKNVMRGEIERKGLAEWNRKTIPFLLAKRDTFPPDHPIHEVLDAWDPEREEVVWRCSVCKEELAVGHAPWCDAEDDEEE